MQIKVKDTRMHRILLQPPHPRNNGFNTEEVPVAEAELVLVEEKYLSIPSIKVDDRIVKPILISHTEKIEVGDWVYTAEGDIITWIDKGNETNSDSKILALPEHFSPKHLQAIVDGKMKEGDKVLLECGKLKRKSNEFTSMERDMVANRIGYASEEFLNELCPSEDFAIKLNSSSHITLHKIEEETNPYNIQVGKQYWFKYLPCNGAWESGMCTRITKFGHPWIKGTKHNGIISPGLYEVQEYAPDMQEVKMYTREEMQDIAFKSYTLRTFDKEIKTTKEFKEWFDQTIK